MPVERIQKVLAARGLGSRREIEEWIRRGEVKVNGRVATLGDSCVPGDRIDVRGRTVHDTVIKHRWIAYHKPEGEICTRKDEQGRPTIFGRLPKVRGGRWVSVGRLDLNTSGLLLLTTDGELAHALMHPTSGIERAYAVRVLGTLPNDALDRLTDGIELEDGLAKALSAVEAGGDGANHWLHVTVAEGRNRLVRRLFQALGVTVSRLIRVRYGAIELGVGLRSGTHRELETEEVKWLYSAAGVKCPLELDAPRRPGGPRTRKRDRFDKTHGKNVAKAAARAMQRGDRQIEGVQTSARSGGRGGQPKRDAMRSRAARQGKGADQDADQQHRTQGVLSPDRSGRRVFGDASRGSVSANRDGSSRGGSADVKIAAVGVLQRPATESLGAEMGRVQA